MSSTTRASGSKPPRDWMLLRFSLYGALKNQQYYEPFLILAFREKGLTFLQIGVLIAFRSVCINLLEVPTGAVADVWGRRRSMMLSMGAYILSFVIFGFSVVYWHFFLAMFLFAIGEAFRTGTHKAMIFDWLRQQGRENEKTRVYGLTRSWSKLGSALSALIAGALVFVTGGFRYIFWWSIPPYLLNIVNFLGYPKSLDGRRASRASVKEVIGLLGRAAVQVIGLRPLRGLIVESMAFLGTFEAVKDYLQPLLKQTALALPVLISLAGDKRTSVLVGITYCFIYVAASAASRNAYRISDRLGGDRPGAGALWAVTVTTYALLSLLLWAGWTAPTVALFLGLHMIQNAWRPMLLSRFNVHAEAGATATVLSIESQAKTLATMIIAPCLGWAVDHAGFWPVGAVGACVSVIGLLAWRIGEPKPAPR